MGRYSIRLRNDDYTVFDRNGQMRVALAKGMTKFTAPSIQLGADDPGRIFTGNEQMNPLGRYIPSTVVSPQPTWIPVTPEVNIAVNMIFAILAAVDDLEEATGSSYNLGAGRTKRIKSFQILNFEDLLPENV